MRISDWSSDVCSSDLFWRDCVDCIADGVPEVGQGSGGGLLEGRLDLGEGEFDGVEVGTVRRQEAKLGPGSLDDLSNGEGLVGGQVVHRSEEHTSELQSLMRISYAGFCLKKKKT